MAFSDIIARLGVSLSLDTAGFTTGSRKAQAEATGLQGRLGGLGKGIIGLGAAFGGLAAAAGLTNVIGQAFEMGSALSEAAEKAGTTAEGLQKVQFAANQSGVSTDTLQSAMARMNKSIGELQLGSPKAAKAFAAIGLSADDLKGKAPEEQLAIIADALNKIPDPQQRVALGAVIMGKGISELLPLINGGSKALHGYYDEAVRNGIITNEQADDLDHAADAWDKFKTKALAATASIVASVIPIVKNFIATMDDLVLSIQAGVANIKSFVEEVVAGVTKAYNAVKTWLQDKVGGVFDSFSSSLKSLGDSLNAFASRLPAINGHTKASLLSFANEGGLQLASFGDTAEAVSVRVQKSFKDMADATLGAIERLSGAVKGGGFLDILGAVIGLGLQLGSVGLFGSKIAGNINGTNVPKMPSPTIPSLSGSFQTASLSRGAANSNVKVEIVDTTGLFVTRVNGQIMQAAPGIASAASNGTMSQMAYRGSRRLA